MDSLYMYNCTTQQLICSTTSAFAISMVCLELLNHKNDYYFCLILSIKNIVNEEN